MNEQEISKKLIEIYDKISEDDYPQILSIIEENVDFEEEYLFEEAFEIAIQLMQSDETKEMHPIVPHEHDIEIINGHIKREKKGRAIRR